MDRATAFSAMACGRGFRIEKMIYIVCVVAVGGTGGGLSLSQADPVHCRYGRVLLLIQPGGWRSAFPTAHTRAGGGAGPLPTYLLRRAGRERCGNV